MRWNSLSSAMRLVLSLGTIVAIVIVLSSCKKSSPSPSPSPGDDCPPGEIPPGEMVVCPPPLNKPDLVVSSVVRPNTVTVDDSLTLNATVLNQGGVDATPTVLTFFWSTDSTISSRDTAIGNRRVDALDKGESVSVQTTYTVTRVGTYYYGACVNPVPGEDEVRNNCSTGTPVDVSAGPAPDLVVSNFSVRDTTVNVGDRIQLEATVRNSGQATSRSTTLRYYRSSDSTITTRDTPVDRDTVSSLRAGQSDDESATVTAPASGTYYYGACVDAVPGEDRTNNNCSGGDRVTVTQPLFGAIAFTSGVSCPNSGTRMSLNYTTAAAAEEAARNACRSRYEANCTRLFPRLIISKAVLQCPTVVPLRVPSLVVNITQSWPAPKVRRNRER